MYHAYIFNIPNIKIICFVPLYCEFLGFLNEGTFLSINSKENSLNDLQFCAESNEFSLEMFALNYLTSEQMDMMIYI